MRKVLAAGAAVLSMGFTQLGPHVHGVSSLGIAVEGDMIQLELQSPGTDFLGFETAPLSPQEQAIMDKVKQQLAQPLSLFALPAAAGCAVVSADTEQVFLGVPESDTTAAPASAPAGTISQYQQQTTHSDLDASYRLQCKNIKAVTALGFPIFMAFPAVQVVHGVVISDRGQILFDVDRPHPSLSLSGAI
jgi:hypothetical protein